MSSANNEKNDIKANLLGYFKGVKSEWGKITWPMRQQVWAETIIVLCIVTAFTALVYVIDIAYKWLFSFLKISQ